LPNLTLLLHSFESGGPLFGKLKKFTGYTTQSLSKMPETQYFLLNIKGKLRAGFTFFGSFQKHPLYALINSVLVTTPKQNCQILPQINKKTLKKIEQLYNQQLFNPLFIYFISNLKIDSSKSALYFILICIFY
jgi:hypothetical protein